MNLTEREHRNTGEAESRDDINGMGEAILRAKTVLIKPHSKVISHIQGHQFIALSLVR